MSDSFQSCELQHARHPRPSLSPRVCSNSCPLGRCCQLTISSSVASYSSCPLPVSRLFISGGQSIGASASATVIPMNIQDWFPLGLTSLISLQSKESSQESSPTPQFKSISSSVLSLLSSLTFTSRLCAKYSDWIGGEAKSTFTEVGFCLCS